MLTIDGQKENVNDLNARPVQKTKSVKVHGKSILKCMVGQNLNQFSQHKRENCFPFCILQDNRDNVGNNLTLHYAI